MDEVYADIARGNISVHTVMPNLQNLLTRQCCIDGYDFVERTSVRYVKGVRSRAD